MIIEDYKKQQAKLQGRSWLVTISASILAIATAVVGIFFLVLIDNLILKIMLVLIFGAATVVFVLYAIAGKKGSFSEVMATVMMLLYV